MEHTETETLLALTAGFRSKPARVGMGCVEQHPEWPLLARVPLRLTASIPLPHFAVRDLLALREGSLVLSTWLGTEDIPLRLGAVQLGWSEFEVVEQRMAVRLTRLA